MTELVAGLALGTLAGAGMVMVKDKVAENSKLEKVKREQEQVYVENETLRSRNKKMERDIEDLLAEKQQLYKKINESGDKHDDVLYELEMAQNQIKKLRVQNQELTSQLQEMKAVCEHYEFDIKRLKGGLE